MVGSHAKIYRIKELGLYKYDVKNYYKDPSRSYITYTQVSNSYSRISCSVVSAGVIEVPALRHMLFLAHALNRTLILPVFSCDLCTGFNKRANQACKNPKNECGLNSFVCIKQFDKHFGDMYREHISLFMMNCGDFLYWCTPSWRTAKSALSCVTSISPTSTSPSTSNNSIQNRITYPFIMNV